MIKLTCLGVFRMKLEIGRLILLDLGLVVIIDLQFDILSLVL